MKFKPLFFNIVVAVVVVAGFVLVSRLGDKAPALEEKNHILTDLLHQSTVVHLPKLGNRPLEEAPQLLLEDSFEKPILVNFSASWCSACKHDTAALNKISETYHDKTIKMVSVASFEEKSDKDISEYVKDKSYPILLDEKGSIAASYGIKTLPHTLLFDSQGAIRFQIKGATSPEKIKQLDTMVKKLVAETSTPATDQQQHSSPGSKSLTSNIEVPEFELVSSSGHPFHSNQLRDKVWVANFIFTRCQSMCPILTSKMKDLQKQFSQESQLKLLSFSVDPENDTPEQLRKYAVHKGVDLQQWYFLTGSWTKIKSVISDGFKVPVPDSPMFHSEKIVLVGPGFKVKGYYSANSAKSLQKLQQDIVESLKSLGSRASS